MEYILLFCKLLWPVCKGGKKSGRHVRRECEGVRHVKGKRGRCGRRIGGRRGRRVEGGGREHTGIGSLGSLGGERLSRLARLPERARVSLSILPAIRVLDA
jgi:hypothetical protein